MLKETEVTFYTYSKLQGSQTSIINNGENAEFYTYSKLQGSQTCLSGQLVGFHVLHLFETTRFSNIHF